MRKKANEVTDTEIIEMINKINKRATRYNDRVWDRQLFETLGIESGGKPLTIDKFDKIFKGKKEYGISMLQDASSRNFIAQINKRYKDTIATILDRMGLNYDADTVRNMSYKEFRKIQKEDTWSYVYDRYNSYMEDLDAESQKPSPKHKSLHRKAQKDIAKWLVKELGY